MKNKVFITFSLALLIIVITGVSLAIVNGDVSAQTFKDRFSGILVDHDADINGDLDVDGTSNLDAVDIDGAVDFGSQALTNLGNTSIDGTLDVDGATTLNSTLDVDGNMTSGTGSITMTDSLLVTSTVTVGSDGAGADVTFYSDTAGDNLLWDTSAEALTITGTNAQDALNVDDGNVDIADDVDVDGTTNLDDVDIDLSSSLNIDGHMVDIGTGSYSTADGDNDLGVAGDLEVDNATDLDGTLDVDGAATLNSTLDVDGNVSSGTGAFTITDAVLVDGGLTDIGGGSYATANGDNDLGVAGDVEVDGSLVLENTAFSGPLVFGSQAAATDGITITHGLSTTPTMVILQPAWSSSTVTQTVYPDNVGSTTFSVEFTDGIVTNTTVYWIAGK